MATGGRWLLALLVALLVGCAVPHPALERPAASSDATPEELLPPGRIIPFTYLGSKTGAWAVKPDGARMAALRYASPPQAMGALKTIINRQKKQPSGQRSSSILGESGYISYGGGRLHGLAWTSGVWLFIAEASSPEKLNSMVAGSPAGGLGEGGAKGSLAKLILIYVVPIVLLLLLLTFGLLMIVKRRMTVAPQPGVPPSSGMELRDRLLALNAPDRPFAVQDGEESDLVAEWKIVDAAWWGIFAKAGLKKTYRLFLRLDEEKHEVRALEEEGSVAWEAGAPAVSYSRQMFRGIILRRYERGVAYGLDGKIYDYRFDPREIKGPVIEVVTAAGWRFSPVYLKRQVRRGPSR